MQINDAVSNWNLLFRKRFFLKKKNTNLSLPPFKSAAKICININGFAFFRLLRPTKDPGGLALEWESFFFSLCLTPGCASWRCVSLKWDQIRFKLGAGGDRIHRIWGYRFPCLQAKCGSPSPLRALLCTGSQCVFSNVQPDALLFWSCLQPNGGSVL